MLNLKYYLEIFLEVNESECHNMVSFCNKQYPKEFNALSDYPGDCIFLKQNFRYCVVEDSNKK